VLLPALFFTVAPAGIPVDFSKDDPPETMSIHVSYRISDV
jgi:hypothetical protein